MNNKKRFCIETEYGHVGAGRSMPIDLYIYSRDTISALKHLSYIPGIKKKNSYFN